MTSDTGPLIATLDTIMTEYDGQLARLLQAQDRPSDVIVTWQVDVDVKPAGMQQFFVAVAVCFHKGRDEEISDIAAQLCPPDCQALFALVPAYHYGRKNFGIYIAEADFGENLVNGLVNEVLEQAGVEAAVIQCS